MTLAPGTRLGSYEIVAPLGAGGMGEVYRANDTRLARSVAIKVVPAAFAADGERLARFEREARTLAALNHPNIAQIHGVEEQPRAADAPPVSALVMELVDGEDLSALIARGPMPLDDAQPIARQIAAALEAAHDQGIVHRDLKPANVKVRADGTVKVLDFGLAKATEPSDASGSDSSRSPTLTARATQAGVILGTAAYMAPEQARGRRVDKRADVWAFGAVLFEMLSGVRAFAGDDVTDTLAAVLRDEPDWSRLPPALPPTLLVYLRRCLRKDPKERVPDMGTMRLALEGAFDASPAPNTAPATGGQAPSRLATRVLGAVTVTAVAIAAFALWHSETVPVEPVRLSIALPAGAEITSYPAITRDGGTIAYVARRGAEDGELYLRDLGSFEARLVAGSSGAQQPLFSPDGRWVAFFAHGQLQKAEVAGGAPVRIADAAYPFGGTWTRDDAIVYAASLGSGLLRVPASGGTPEPISTPDGGANGYAHVYPQALPGGRRLLFTIWGQVRGSAVLDLASGRWQMVLPSKAPFTSAQYDPSSGAPGRLLAIDEAAGIREAPFDPTHPTPTSADQAVLSDVFFQPETDSHGWLAVSETGTAVYAPGNPARSSLVWLDQNGVVTALSSGQDAYREVAISPDGTRAAVRKGLNLWVQDLVRGTSSPLTASDSNLLPVWSRDGQRIVFGSNRGGDWDIYVQPAEGSGPAQVLLKRPADQLPYAFAPDGTLLYVEIAPTTGRDLWTLSPDGKASPFRVTRFNEFAAEFSPEAGGPHWVAYTSDESGRPEIYLHSYPEGSRRIVVSTSGGVRPMWSPDGRELYYVTSDALVAVSVQPDATFGAPRKLADRTFLVNDRFRTYSVAPDGERLLMIRQDEGSVPRQLNVILNWSGATGRR